MAHPLVAQRPSQSAKTQSFQCPVYDPQSSSHDKTTSRHDYGRDLMLTGAPRKVRMPLLLNGILVVAAVVIVWKPWSAASSHYGGTIPNCNPGPRGSRYHIYLALYYYLPNGPVTVGGASYQCFDTQMRVQSIKGGDSPVGGVIPTTQEIPSDMIVSYWH